MLPATWPSHEWLETPNTQGQIFSVARSTDTGKQQRKDEMFLTLLQFVSHILSSEFNLQEQNIFPMRE